MIALMRLRTLCDFDTRNNLPAYLAMLIESGMITIEKCTIMIGKKPTSETYRHMIDNDTGRFR